MQKPFWWWQCSNGYVISFCPTSTPLSPIFSPSLISLMVSLDIKHHVYLLLLYILSYIQVQCYHHTDICTPTLGIWELEFVMSWSWKVILTWNSTQQIFYFSPNVQARDNKLAKMTTSVSQLCLIRASPNEWGATLRNLSCGWERTTGWTVKTQARFLKS